MKNLLIINSKNSGQTARFWQDKKEKICSAFKNSELYYPENDSSEFTNIGYFELIILVGNDSFFSRQINQIFEYLVVNKLQTVFAFIPDSANSALASSLSLPKNTDSLIKVIKSNNVIPLDLVRCYYTNNKNEKSDYLILNDALIGVDTTGFSFYAEAALQWGKSLISHNRQKSIRQLELYERNNHFFSGPYFFSLLLLGNQITGGPLIKKRPRINLLNFDYFQFPPLALRQMLKFFSYIYSGSYDLLTKKVLHKKMRDLEIKTPSQNNPLIIDGMLMGRLPAEFIFLPRTIQVISAANCHKIKERWSIPVYDAEPVISRTTPLNREKKN